MGIKVRNLFQNVEYHCEEEHECGLIVVGFFFTSNGCKWFCDIWGIGRVLLGSLDLRHISQIQFFVHISSSNTIHAIKSLCDLIADKTIKTFQVINETKQKANSERNMKLARNHYYFENGLITVQANCSTFPHFLFLWSASEKLERIYMYL